ncbi:MAG: hypothetical protein HZC44_06220 [Geobacter sp.]|nr:hypothetical protein [Geobacter sp.]
MVDEPKIPQQDLPSASQIDFLFKIISRYDTYITSTNAKASLIIAWNGVVIGAILLKYQEIISQFSCVSKVSTLAGLLLVICGILALVSNGLIFGVVFPFLTASREDGRGSLIYFGSVAKTDPQEYTSSIQAVSSSDLIEELAQQASTLAVGLEKKMRRLQKSIWAIYGELVSIALLVILFACNV